MWDHDRIDLAGFKLYISEIPGDHTKGDPGAIIIPYTGSPADLTCEQVIDSPNNEAHTYYFVMTAYDAERNESDFSNEVSAVIDFESPSKPFNFRIIFRSD